MLDGLVERVLSTYAYRFTQACSADDRAVAFRMRGDAAGSGWDEDSYDDVAVLLLGRDGDGEPVSTGRLVLPPHPLPTQDACGIVVEPAGRVVDVGRMCVATTYRSYRQAAYVALLCGLYREMREGGFATACGMMSPPVRRLTRLIGLTLEELGPDRQHLGEPRAPVRFALTAVATGQSATGE